MEYGPALAEQRLTRVGRFLRHYSLDHLPQLFNLLQGNMHLVGPCPMQPEQSDLDDPELMPVQITIQHPKNLF